MSAQPDSVPITLAKKTTADGVDILLLGVSAGIWALVVLGFVWAVPIFERFFAANAGPLPPVTEVVLKQPIVLVCVIAGGAWLAELLMIAGCRGRAVRLSIHVLLALVGLLIIAIMAWALTIPVDSIYRSTLIAPQG